MRQESRCIYWKDGIYQCRRGKCFFRRNSLILSESVDGKERREEWIHLSVDEKNHCISASITEIIRWWVWEDNSWSWIRSRENLRKSRSLLQLICSCCCCCCCFFWWCRREKCWWWWSNWLSSFCVHFFLIQSKFNLWQSFQMLGYVRDTHTPYLFYYVFDLTREEGWWSTVKCNTSWQGE
jgi:hypothetical protein